MNYCLTQDILIQLSAIDDQISNQSKLILNSGNFYLAFGEILNFPDLSAIFDKTIGSEHWMSESSDIFRFFENGNLHSILSNVPGKRRECIDNLVFFDEKINFKVKIIEPPKFFQVEPVSNYFFDVEGRIIYCFNERVRQVLHVFHLDENFALLFNECNDFSGWKLNRPIELLCAGFQDDHDWSEVSREEYLLFEKYLEMLSDDFCRKYDDDMEILVFELKKQFGNEILSKIIGKKRRSLLEKSIKDMEDYFL